MRLALGLNEGYRPVRSTGFRGVSSRLTAFFMLTESMIG